MKLGNLYATRRIDQVIQENKQFKDDINAALNIQIMMGVILVLLMLK